MTDSTYKIIDLVGSSPKSWEDAAANAIARASKSLRDLRIAEVVKQDAAVIIQPGIVKEIHLGLGQDVCNIR